jgi:hypothetical protein
MVWHVECLWLARHLPVLSRVNDNDLAREDTLQAFERGQDIRDRTFRFACRVECRESHVRLRIHEACRIGPVDDARTLRVEAAELVAIIGAIVRNTKRNAGLPAGSAQKARILNS